MKNARDGIRTQELLRDQPLKLAPLTGLGYPRACIDYFRNLINVGEIEGYTFFGALFLSHGLFVFPFPQTVLLDLSGDGLW